MLRSCCSFKNPFIIVLLEVLAACARHRTGRPVRPLIGAMVAVSVLLTFPQE